MTSKARYICVMFVLLLITTCAVSVLMFGLRYVETIRCRNQFRSIQLAAFVYASDHDGHFPHSWSNVYNYIAGCAQVFACPSVRRSSGSWTNIDMWSSYVLIPGRRKADTVASILAFEPLRNHGNRGGHILFTSGEVKWCWPEQYNQYGISNNIERVH